MSVLAWNAALQQDMAQSVAGALAEDLGSGDVTAALIPAKQWAYATVISREPAIVCGLPWFEHVYHQLSGHDTPVHITWRVADGECVASDQVLCQLHGPARAVLSGERTALNFLQTLSGTATLTRRYVDAVAGLPVRILDTRKTLPGLRRAQKYAVRCGGGHNHRLGLYDAILIKENHILAAGSVTAAVALARAHAPGLPIEIEVENLTELTAALAAEAQTLLLDNFDLPTLHEAVTLTAGRARLEASGGITLDNIRAMAQTGVDDISIGALTKHVQAVDLSMRFSSALSL